jgi:phosphatidylethanolamine/phosphatidyl-N-methylethanolamine N-methyltransferase
MSHQVVKCRPDWMQFLYGFACRPLKVASVWPSSKDLGHRLAGLSCLHRARLVIELGPGLGGTTRAILSAMPADAQLLGIEIVEQFAEALRTIPDPRLHVVQGCAHELNRVLSTHRLPRPDVIVSGIPFSTMSREKGAALVKKIHAALPIGGTFVTYQFWTCVRDFADELFGPARESVVLANFPPLHLFEWQKGSTRVASLKQQHLKSVTRDSAARVTTHQ